MIVKTRSLTESLEKLYEAYEVETDDELDAIMDDDTLSDEEKEAEIGRVLDKHDKLNEDVEDCEPYTPRYPSPLTWYVCNSGDDYYDYFYKGYSEDKSFEVDIWPVSDEYSVQIFQNGECIANYRTIAADDDAAIDIVSVDYEEEFLTESLTEAENPENAEINSVIRRTVGKKNISKKDAQALADAGIERDEYGDLTGKNGRRLVKSGTAIHGPGKTYHKYGKTDYRKGYDGKTTRWDLRKNSADMVGAKHADKWDKVDLKNYLDSEKPHNEWETEQDSNKKLRPYSDKYQEYKRRKDSASWGVDRANREIKSEEEIEKLVQEYRDKLMKQRERDLEWQSRQEGSKEYYDKQIKDIQAQAKAKHPQYESLNEAQLNENPLIAAAARAAIPAAIDVASNAISSVIDAKLNDSKDTELNEAEGNDNELSFDEIMAKEKTSGNMDWYKKDKPNWKQVTEEE